MDWAGHLILVGGINKVVPNLGGALDRIRTCAFRLENARARIACGTPGVLGKCVILAMTRMKGV
jgi:hypothetical protein